jgi:transcriptional regulator with XRE-family HTH domain
MRCHIEGFPERLGELMRALGWNQKKFSQRVGITEAALSQLLAGLRDPAASTLIKLHRATGCSVDHLLGTEMIMPAARLRTAGEEKE